MEAHAYTSLPAHLNSAINPLFYYVFNPKIREGYFIFLNVITCHRFFQSKVAATNSSSSGITARSARIAY